MASSNSITTPVDAISQRPGEAATENANRYGISKEENSEYRPFLKPGFATSTGKGRDLVVIEPAVFMTFLAVILTNTVTQTLFLERTCQQELKLNSTECLQLDDAAKGFVQPKAAKYLMIKTIVENFLPAVLSLFLGPWSDAHGRRPLLMWPMLGYSITFALYAMLSMQQHLLPVNLLPASVPVALSGGFIAVLFSSNSYVTDITALEQRSFRLSMLDACFYLSLLLGNASFAPLLTVSGFVGVYTVAATLCFVSFLYVLLLVKESVPISMLQPIGENDCCFPWSNLFQIEMVKEMAKTCFKWRPNYGRTIIFLVIFAIITADTAAEGENIVFYLFTNKTYGWGVQNFSLFASVTIFLRIVAMIGGVYVVSKKLNLSESAVSVVAYASKVIASFIAALSSTPWILYAASGVGIFSGMTGPLNRSILTKTVPTQDIGKVFCLMASLEALTPLLAAPLYTTVYDGTILSFPGAFFLVSAGIFALDTFMLWNVRYLETSPHIDYDEI